MKTNVDDMLRVEFKPESEEEESLVRLLFRRIKNGEAICYYGDSDEFGGAFIINAHQADGSTSEEAQEPAVAD